MWKWLKNKHRRQVLGVVFFIIGIFSAFILGLANEPYEWGAISMAVALLLLL